MYAISRRKRARSLSSSRSRSRSYSSSRGSYYGAYGGSTYKRSIPTSTPYYSRPSLTTQVRRLQENNIQRAAVHRIIRTQMTRSEPDSVGYFMWQIYANTGSTGSALNENIFDVTNRVIRVWRSNSTAGQGQDINPWQAGAAFPNTMVGLKFAYEMTFTFNIRNNGKIPAKFHLYKIQAKRSLADDPLTLFAQGIDDETPNTFDDQDALVDMRYNLRMSEKFNHHYEIVHDKYVILEPGAEVTLPYTMPRFVFQRSTITDKPRTIKGLTTFFIMRQHGVLAKDGDACGVLSGIAESNLNIATFRTVKCWLLNPGKQVHREFPVGGFDIEEPKVGMQLDPATEDGAPCAVPAEMRVKSGIHPEAKAEE